MSEEIPDELFHAALPTLKKRQAPLTEIRDPLAAAAPRWSIWIRRAFRQSVDGPPSLEASIAPVGWASELPDPHGMAEAGPGESGHEEPRPAGRGTPQD
jgi:hypothetical protein